MDEKVIAIVAAVAGSTVGCAPPQLPAREVLEGECHVWYDNGSGEGIYAWVDGVDSRVRGGDADVAGPTMVGDSTIEFDGNQIGTFANGTLTIVPIRLGMSEYSGAVDGDAPWIDLDGESGEPVRLNVAEACSASEAALGAAGVFLGLND